MDIISYLPVEIGLRIFDYLYAEELACCSLVCRKWYCLANCDSLWRKFPPKEECFVYPKLKDSSRICKHKAWYARRALSLKKWLKCNYWIHYGQLNAAHALMGNGAIFVEALGKNINVYDLNDGEANLINSVDMNVPGISFDKNCSTWFNDSILVLQTKWSSLLWCYKWMNGALVFVDGVYGISSGAGNISLASYSFSGLPQSKDTSVVRWNRILLEGDYLIMPHAKTKIYIWSLEKAKCVVILTNFPPGGFCNVFTNKGLVYACCYQEMLVYNLAGMQKATVRYDIVQFTVHDCFLFFNNTTILAAFSGGTLMHAAWDLNLNMLARPFDLDSIGMLHPSLPAVCFIQNVETELLAKKFVAIDIESKAILWQSESFHCSRIFTKFVPNFNYVILDQTYMIYFCSRETNEPGAFRSWFLINLLEGKIESSCTLPFKSHLYRPTYCGNKVVIYDTSYKANMCFIFT